MTNLWEKEEGKRGSHFCGAEAGKGMFLNFFVLLRLLAEGRGGWRSVCVCAWKVSEEGRGRRRGVVATDSSV